MPLTACVMLMLPRLAPDGDRPETVISRSATVASHLVQMHVHLALRTHGIMSMITHVRCSRGSLTVTSLSDGSVAETASAISVQGSLAGASEREVSTCRFPTSVPRAIPTWARARAGAIRHPSCGTG